MKELEKAIKLREKELKGIKEEKNRISTMIEDAKLEKNVDKLFDCEQVYADLKQIEKDYIYELVTLEDAVKILKGGR